VALRLNQPESCLVFLWLVNAQEEVKGVLLIGIRKGVREVSLDFSLSLRQRNSQLREEARGLILVGFVGV
jgi:hypothetical protein